MVYWLVSLPVGGRRRETTWELLQEKTSGSSSNYKLDIPELRVGTLDTLMALSDELSKTTAMVEAVVSKIRRQVNDTGGLAAVSGLKVEAVSTDTYVQRFKWDEAKFPARRPLKEAVEKMAEVVSRIEDDLKVRCVVGSPGSAWRGRSLKPGVAQPRQRGNRRHHLVGRPPARSRQGLRCHHCRQGCTAPGAC